MDIRKDFDSASPYLHRLYGIGSTFRKLAIEDWSHMRNREDFDRVYRLDQPLRSKFENLYGDGRDMAYFMSDQLRSFNSIEDFPSMSSYVDSFDSCWSSSIDSHKERLADLSVYAGKSETPWAVRQMIRIWETQVKLLETVNATVNLLKQTDIYRIENGEIKVTDLNKQNINIGNVHGGKINIGSIDNAVTINISAHRVFENIKQALNSAELPTAERDMLVQHVTDMEAEAGKPSFVQRYQNFIAASANHMTLLAPFIPALTKLIGIA